MGGSEPTCMEGCPSVAGTTFGIGLGVNVRTEPLGKAGASRALMNNVWRVGRTSFQLCSATLTYPTVR
jgi:hypothetical protein